MKESQTKVFTILRLMKEYLLYIMAAVYIAAGCYHFINPRLYKKIMPAWIPWHYPLIYFTGVCEIVLGVLLFPDTTRAVAAWGLIVLLIAIFPANVQMAVNFKKRNNRFLWIAIARLPLQLLLVWWAWQYT